jgi:hypothetical protein
MAAVQGKKKSKKLTDREIAAYTLLGEAGGEGSEGMRAVMHVLVNRANSGRFPSTIGGVATQQSGGTYQFTTWSPKHGNSPTTKYSKDSEAFKKALAVVDEVIGGKSVDPTGGALHYYANTGASGIGKPWWFDREATGGAVQIGNHNFAATGPVTPVPRDLPKSVVNQRNGLTPGGLQLPRPLGAPPARNPAGSSLEDRDAAAGTGGLTTRPVQSIPIKLGAADADAFLQSNLGVRPAATPNAGRIDLQDREAARQAAAIRATQSVINARTETRTAAGGVQTSSRAGDAVLPPGFRPSPNALPYKAPGIAAPTMQETRAEQTIQRMVAKKVQVKNPAYLAWEKKYGDGSQIQTAPTGGFVTKNQLAAIQSTAGLPVAAPAVPPPPPQFITQDLMVPVTETVMVPVRTAAASPVAPAVAPRRIAANAMIDGMRGRDNLAGANFGGRSVGSDGVVRGYNRDTKRFEDLSQNRRLSPSQSYKRDLLGNRDMRRTRIPGPGR